MDLRRQLLPANDPEIAIALSNLALLQVSTGEKLNEAVSMLEEALSIDKLCAEEDRRKVTHLRHLNLCFAYQAMGNISRAR